MTPGIDDRELPAQSGADAEACPSSVDEDAFLLPMTPLQRRIWREDRARSGTSALNGAFRVEITGPLDTGILTQAIRLLGDRHEILKASCVVIDGEPQLVVRPGLLHELAVVDLSHFPVKEADAAAEQQCAEIAKRPFDLENGALGLFTLIRIEPERAILTLTFHQMIIDGWSVSLLLGELPQLYVSISENDPSRVPAPKLQFGDYAAWLEAAASEPETQAQIADVAGRLDDYRRLDLPPDLPAGGDATASAIIARTLPTDLVDSINAYCAREGATMFSVSLAACLIVLAKATGRSDVSVGSPLAGRERPELEGVVGPLVNYAILRADIGATSTLRSIERAVRDAALDAVATQSLPLKRVLDHLEVTGQPVPEPPYSVAFVSQRGFAGTSAVTHEFAGCRMRTLPSLTQGSLHDLFFFLVERETGWRLAVDYAASKFSAGLADDLLDAFLESLDALTRRSDLSVADLDAPALSRLAARAVAPAMDIAPVEVAQAETVPTADDHSDDDAGPFIVPASLTQGRFHLLAQASPDNPGFNMPACLRIRGPLSPDVLARSLDALIERQEILRTSFIEHDGSLQQVIAASASVTLPLTDLSATAVQDREAVARSESQKDALITFDLAEAPLFRARLVRFAEDDHVLILIVHHIISDGQSMGLLQRELWQLYDSLATGKPSPLAPLAVQYADFATSQKDWIESDTARSQLDYWSKTLAGPLPVADFPLDRSPSFGRTAGTAIEIESLSPALVEALSRLAASEGTTMFVVTGAAFSALIARYCGQTDVLFGCPIANRTAESADIMGPFAGPLAIRVGLEGNPTLKEIVTRVSDRSLDALANSTVPFERIIELCDARSVDGRSPLFQFYFLYQKAFLQKLETNGLTVSPLPTISVGTPYELQLALIERPGDVSLQLEYNPALLDRETVRSIVAYYIDALERLVSDPGQCLDELPKPAVRDATQRLRLAASRRPQLPFTAPRTELERQLAVIWCDLLKRDSISVHDDFFALGGQSILAARMVVEVKRTLDTRISVSTVAFARTIAELADVIGSDDDRRTAPRLIPMRPTGTRDPLFLVHCGGGHVLRYEDLVATLPEDQPVYGLAAPDFEGSESDISVESLARIYVEEIRKVRPHGPYQIGGYSFGGLVAYEMATRLVEAGEEVSLVAIFDTLNRAHFQNQSLKSRAQFNVTYVADRLNRYRRKLAAGDFAGFAESAARAVTRRIKIARVRAARGENTIVRKPPPDQLQDNLALFNDLADRYVPRAFPGEVLVFHAEERGAEYRDTPMLGWDAVAAKVSVAFVPGDHMAFIKKPNVGALVAQLRAYQDRHRTEMRASARHA